MSNPINELEKRAGLAHLALTTKSKFVGALLGCVLSRFLPVEKVENHEDYYNVNCLPLVNQILSSLNEKMLFDVRTAAEHTRCWWLGRASAINPVNLTIVPGTYGMIDTYFNTSNIWAPVEHAFINEVKEAMLSCYSAAVEVLRAENPSLIG